MKKLGRSGLKKEWADIFQEMDKRDIKRSNEEIQKEICNSNPINEIEQKILSKATFRVGFVRFH